MRFVLPLVAAAMICSPGSARDSKAFDLVEVAHLPVAVPTVAVAWSSDGSHLAALVWNDVVTWNTASWAATFKCPVLLRFHIGRSLAYVAGGILVGAPDQIPAYNGPADAYIPGAALVLWNPTIGAPLRRFPNPDAHSPNASTHVQDVFEVSPDGQQIAAVNTQSFDPVVFVYDTATGSLLHTISAPPVPRPLPQFELPPEPNPTIQENFEALAYSPSGRMLAACGFSGRAYLLDALAGTIIRIFPAYGEGVECSAIAFSADGKLLATGRVARNYVALGHQPRPGEQMTLEPNTGNVRVWDVSSGRMIASLPNAVGTTRALSWSRSGYTLVAGDDGTLHELVFDGANVSEVATVEVPGGVFSMAFSPDGRLAVLGNGQSITIYR